MPEETAEELFDLGKYHSSLKNRRSAIEAYKKCVKLDPMYFKAWSNLAAEYFKLKKFQKSLEYCKKALEINQYDKNSWLTLAANYFQINDDGRSLFCFHRASVLGNKKAERFLKKAERLKDKLLNAELIDVYSEILGKKASIKAAVDDEIAKEINKRRKEFYMPHMPDITDVDYLEQLTRFLLEIGDLLIVKTGGVVSILELYSFVKSKYPLFRGTLEELVKALNILKREKLIIGIKSLPSGIKIVEFLPSDLTADIKDILKLASERDYLTFQEIIKNTSWDEYRIERAMELLEQKNIAKKIESYREGVKWFFPGVYLELK